MSASNDGPRSATARSDMEVGQMPRTRVIHVHDMASHPDAVYIGRAAPRRRLKASKWANPYTIGPDGDRSAVIAKYRARMQRRLAAGPVSMAVELRKLAGKPLACWCRHDGEERTPDNACHGDVLVDLIDALGLDGVD